MMDFNPFPQYPVAQLSEMPAKVYGRTWVTDPIRQERALIASWVEHPEKQLIVAVLGEYGSGKTHLLLDAMATLRKDLDRREDQPSLLPVVAVAERPLGWYRAEIGPKLAGLPLEDLVLSLYAKAGQEVAGRAELTRAAVGTLARKPQAILTLVREDLLSRTEVEAVFRDMLDSAVTDAPPDIRQALALLRWDTAPDARRWLAGEELTKDKAERLGLPLSIGTDERALDTLLAVAALHNATGRVFALFVDEAEHFLRTEGNGGQNPNVTSMKRLIEELARRHAVVFVAGHLSAWDTLRDYHDRFSPPRPIVLENLTGPQVRLLVARRVPEARDLGESQSDLVAEFGEGNMRSISSLLRELYERSEGFTEPLSLIQIEAAAKWIRQQPKPETILLRVYELLESFDFTVVRERQVAGVRFDLVALHGNRPQVVVSLNYAPHELEQGAQVRRMIEQMREVNKQYPETVGCFLAEGRLDAAVRAQLTDGSAERIVLCEVTGPSFADDLSGQLRPLLANAAPPDLKRLDRIRRGAIGQLDQLQAARGQELDRVLDGRGESKIDASSRGPALQTSVADYRDRISVTYEELTRPPSFSSRVSRIWEPMTFLAAFVTGLGLFLLIFTIAQGAIFRGSGVDYNLQVALQYLVAFALMFLGLFGIVRDFISIEQFYEYRNERLRSAYLRSEDPRELIEINDELQMLLDRKGPRWRRVIRGRRY
jgi:hypothetical protein